jgi:hypothetical protein
VLRLRPEQIEVLRSAVVEERMRSMAERLRADFKAELADRDASEVLDSVRATVHRMRAYGFRSTAHLYRLAAWGLFFGPDYEARLGDRRLERICRENIPEDEKFKRFTEAILEPAFTRESPRTSQR